ncbi:MAG TPA: flagellar biosynthesis protein FlhA [Terriglobales bacterium]|nr:flagellar biosynthesis protein FlhA [Terriglobales bacterium]
MPAKAKALPAGPAAPGAPAAAPKSGAMDWSLPIAAVGLVFLMLVPVPALLLDLLLTLSIATAVLVLLVAVQILRPVQFSVFPSLLLLLTLFRLSLNLASSRRILLHGGEGVAAAGHVIEAFGQFVVGGNYVVGFVIFLALIAIQYLVVSHGAVRTAEVTARFTLDALPGKQMAIDADLNAGLIDELQARQRREAIAREAEFYGAMDGAARFSQRDAMATILITAINIIAGFLIGVFQQHLDMMQALKTYTILTVGDGLVTMIPSLLVSVAGAIVITRASSDNTLGADLGSQLLARPRALWIAGGALVSLALMPGLPKFSFLSMAAVLGYGATRLAKKAAAAPDAAAATSSAAAPEALEPLLKVETLALEVGYALVPLVDEAQGGKLLPRVRALRKQLALQLGFIIPSIHITDNLQLQPREYAFSLRGVEIGRFETYQNHLLAIHSGLEAPPLEGKETREPAFGVAARWIAPQQQEQALADGFAVVDQTAVMATHIAELIRQNAYELLTRQETQRLLDALADTQPKLVEELVPKLLSLGELQRILQQLLREHVSIRDLPTILEALIETAAVRKNPVALVEAARQALGRALVQPLLGADGSLQVITLAQPLEEELNRSFDQAAPAPGLAAAGGSLGKRVLEGLRRFAYDPAAGAPQVLLCHSPGRFYLRRMLEASWPRLSVLSPGEIPAKTQVHSLGMVS